MRKQALNEKINTSNMTRLRLLVICFLEIIFSRLLITGHTRSSPPLLEKHVAFFIFGDSLVDAGNNSYINTTTNFQANFVPYGETFFKYPTGRFSDGRIIPDFTGMHYIYIYTHTLKSLGLISNYFFQLY